MKIPASPLLFASLGLTSSTLAAPVARGRESSPFPNPDCEGFDAPARMPVPRAVSGSTAPGAARLAQRDEGPKSVMIGRKNKGRRSRRTVSMGNPNIKRQEPPKEGEVNANGLLDGGLLKPVGELLGGLVDTVGGLVDGVGGALPGGLGDHVKGIVDPLTGHLSEGLKTGTVPGITHGALDGVGGAVDGLNGGLLKGVLGRRDGGGGLLGTVGQITGGLPIVGGLTQQVTDGLANGTPVSGVVGTVNGLVGTVGNVLPGGLGNTVTGLTGGLLGGVGATADGLLAPVVGQNGILNGVIGENGVVGGLLGGSGLVGGVLGDQGVVGGLLGNNGLVGGVLGDQGVVDGLLGNDGLVGGLLGGNGAVGGLLGGGGNGGLLGGSSSGGGLLGGLLGGGGAQKSAPSTQSTSGSPTSDPLAIIKSQGGIVRDLGNGQFLTSTGGVVQVPLKLAAQLGGLLSKVTQTASGTVSKVASAATSALPSPLAGVAGVPLGVAQGALDTVAHTAGGALNTAQNVASGAAGTVQGVVGTAINAAGGAAGGPLGALTDKATGDAGTASSTLAGITANLPGPAGSAAGTVQNLAANTPLSALGDLSKVDLSSLSPADLQQLAAFASGSLPATSALMQNLAVDPAAMAGDAAQRVQGLPGTGMGGHFPLPTPSAAPAITNQALDALGATPVGAMVGAASHAAPSNLPTGPLPLGTLTAAASGIASAAANPTPTGKVPSSDAARAMASQIVQKGQQLSDEEYAAKIQALKDQLARMTAAASGTAGDAAGQAAAAQLNALLALGNGLTNADLGRVDGIQLGPQGARVVPTSAAPSALPTATNPSTATAAIGNIASVPAAALGDTAQQEAADGEEYDDCSSCDEDEWNTEDEDEDSEEEGMAQILNADVYPNFFSGDNTILGVAQAQVQGQGIGLASATSATNIAASAITRAPVPSASGIPAGTAQPVLSALRSVSSGLPAVGLPTGSATPSGIAASASMIPQNSSGLA